jgi:hypothetical protein
MRDDKTIFHCIWRLFTFSDQPTDYGIQSGLTQNYYFLVDLRTFVHHWNCHFQRKHYFYSRRSPPSLLWNRVFTLLGVITLTFGIVRAWNRFICHHFSFDIWCCAGSDGSWQIFNLHIHGRRSLRLLSATDNSSWILVCWVFVLVESTFHIEYHLWKLDGSDYSQSHDIRLGLLRISSSVVA